MAVVKLRKLVDDADLTDGGDESRACVIVQVLDPAGFTHEIKLLKGLPYRAQVIEFLRKLNDVFTYEI